jgi:hypothetical protein
VEKLETEEKQQPTAQDMLATWTMTVIHPDTSGAGADSPKRCRRPHWTTAKGNTWEMETE